MAVGPSPSVGTAENIAAIVRRVGALTPATRKVPEEVDPGFGGEGERRSSCRELLPLDVDLHGRRVGREGDRRRDRDVVRIGEGVAERQPLQLVAHADRAGCVLAPELAELPLPGEHPHRIGDRRAESRFQHGSSGGRLQAVPAAVHDATAGKRNGSGRFVAGR